MGQKNTEKNIVHIAIENKSKYKFPYAKEMLISGRLDKNKKYTKGTGFIYSHKNKKYIITCAHTIENYSLIDKSEIRIFQHGGKELVSGRLLGKDYFTDIAVIELNSPVGNIGMKLGGSPVPNTEVRAYGMLNDRISTDKDGIILSNNKSFSNLFWNLNYVISSAKISKGFSGGPLVSPATGKVVGMNAQVLEDKKTGHFTYFFINPNILKKVVFDIIKNGEHKRRFSGLVLTQRCEKSGDVDGCEAPIFIHESSVRFLNEKKIKKIIDWEVVTINGIKINSLKDILEIRETLTEMDYKLKLIVRNFTTNQEKEIHIPLKELENDTYEKMANIFMLQHNIQSAPEMKNEWTYRFKGNNTIVLGAGLKHWISPNEQLFTIRTKSDWGKIIWLNSVAGFMTLELSQIDRKDSFPITLGIFSDDMRMKGIFF